MKRWVLFLMLTGLLGQPTQAAKADDLLRGLLQAGTQAVQEALPPEAGAATPTTPTPTTPTPTAPPQGSPDLLSALLGDMQAQSRAYLDQLKEEGRQYAREVGKTVVAEIKKDKEVESTLHSLRLLCWGVVAYITLMSLLIFGMLCRINALLRRLQRER
ncbi:MAG: hypothetical protein ACI4PZ_06735 [Akkermansia sp.]